MTKIANVLRLVLLIAHGALSATADPKQPSVHQRDTIDNNAVNLTLPDNFDFTVDGDRYIVNNFQPPYTPIFEFYRFLIVCMNNVLLDVVSQDMLHRLWPSCSLYYLPPPRHSFDNENNHV